MGAVCSCDGESYEAPFVTHDQEDFSDESSDEETPVNRRFSPVHQPSQTTFARPSPVAPRALWTQPAAVLSHANSIPMGSPAFAHPARRVSQFPASMLASPPKRDPPVALQSFMSPTAASPVGSLPARYMMTQVQPLLTGQSPQGRFSPVHQPSQTTFARPSPVAPRALWTQPAAVLSHANSIPMGSPAFAQPARRVSQVPTYMLASPKRDPPVVLPRLGLLGASTPVAATTPVNKIKFQESMMATPDTRVPDDDDMPEEEPGAGTKPGYLPIEVPVVTLPYEQVQGPTPQVSSDKHVGFGKDVKEASSPSQSGCKAPRKGTGFVSPDDLPQSDEEDEDQEVDYAAMAAGSGMSPPATINHVHNVHNTNVNLDNHEEHVHQQEVVNQHQDIIDEDMVGRLDELNDCDFSTVIAEAIYLESSEMAASLCPAERQLHNELCVEIFMEMLSEIPFEGSESS